MKRDPIDARSSDAAYMADYYELASNLVDGAAAIRNAGTDYLPKFTDEDDSSYNYRLRMTKFTNIYRDVVEALANKAFEEPITLVGDAIPSAIREFATNVDGGGSDLNSFASGVFFNGINSAVDWIFVDYPAVAPGAIRTIEDSKRAGVRPFWSRVIAQNMLEVQTSIVSGSEQLQYARICEPGTPHQVRIMRVMLGQIVYFLLQRTDALHVIDPDWLWTPAEKDEKTRYVEVSRGVMSIDVIPLVPFYTGRRHGRSWRFSPAMRDAADLQIELYQEESALKFACIMTAFPMLAGNGVRPEMMPDGKTPRRLAIGPNRVIYAPPDASGNVGSWSFVEPQASSLKFLQERIRETVSQLRELGRQPLTAQSGNLTVITTAVAAGKSKSAVGAWAGSLEVALNSALAITAKFLGVEYRGTVNVYDDFDEFDQSGKDIGALAEARKNRDLSQKTYWRELQRRRILSDTFDAEAEIEALLDETSENDEDAVEI